MTKSTYRRVLLGVLFLCIVKNAFSQRQEKSTATSNTLVSLSFVNARISEILSSIQNQTGLTFFYSNNLLNATEKRTIKVNNVPLDQALSLLLDQKKLMWQIDPNARSVRIRRREVIAAIQTINQPGDTSKSKRLFGQVLNNEGQPLIGATIKVQGTNLGAKSDVAGRFEIPNMPGEAVLEVSYTGYQSQSFFVAGQRKLQVILTSSSKELNVVEVVSTGYQRVAKERATGSFVLIDNNLINRSTGPDVLSRLKDVTSGLGFNPQANRTGPPAANGGDPEFSIRGRSTLFANTNPLIILDNFPYEGDISNINPNDIESITVLKDAAAASIWGVRAANGVIVMTTKKGRVSSKPVIAFNTNLTVFAKPDVFSIPQIDSKDYIGLEKYLFDNGKYDGTLQYLPWVLQSPVIDILDSEKKGEINHDQAAAKLAQLSSYDARKDYSKYFLRKAVNQQYALSISGGNEIDQYYISGGFDRNLGSSIPNDYNRFTLNARNNYKLVNNRLELVTDLFFTKSMTAASASSYSNAYPYERVIDDNGNPVSVIRDWRQAFKNQLNNSKFLDWNYYPVNEKNDKDNKTNLSDYRINLGLNYKIWKNLLSLSLNYQYQQGNIDQTILYDKNSYTTRLLINQYMQLDPAGIATYPIPLGGIYNNNSNNYKSNTARIQVNYDQKIDKKQRISALAGMELKDYNSFNLTNYLYGYNKDNATSVPVDYFRDFPLQIGDRNERIPLIYGQNGIIDRFISYYLNAAYTINDRYVLSVSGRRDESNLFGVSANQKGVPLYSVGMAWNISQENFYRSDQLPYLRLRITDGYNGNLSKNLSSYTTAKTDISVNRYNMPTQTIINPPNPQLSWEKVNVINAGIDFGFRDNKISGSIEAYRKNGQNLIGNSPIAPQTGVVQFTGNTADMETKGVDISINTINLQRQLTWTTNALFNYVKDKVTDYKLQVGVNSFYVNENYSNPIIGKPYSAIFAYPWGGLDTAGNPQSYVDGKLSKDYAGIVNSTNISDLEYVGTATPTIFGSLRNTLEFKGIEFSFNITYKFGYYFRRGSFNSSNTNFQQADFLKRWQKTGDELLTNVPKLIFPADPQRDQVYEGSRALVERGDHIRLQDIQLAYNIKNNISRFPFKTIKIYGYANNIGIIWRKNKLGLDPDYTGNQSYFIPNPRSYSIGINASF
jgi:TonB-linked SusC/RagA family outer membrane protein